MDLKNFGYSMKNIPIPSKNSYLKSLLEKAEAFIRRLRWKAYFYDKRNSVENDENDNRNSKFGFKSNHSPPQNKHLKPFEDDLYDVIRSIEFKPVKSQFLKKLKDDVSEIKNSQNMYVFADKTTNIYTMQKEDYGKLLKDNISKAYKKSSGDVKKDIDKEASGIAKQLKLEERMEKYANRNAYITLKDH